MAAMKAHPADAAFGFGIFQHRYSDNDRLYLVVLNHSTAGDRAQRDKL
jgi:hypothetical protein